MDAVLAAAVDADVVGTAASSSILSSSKLASNPNPRPETSLATPLDRRGLGTADGGRDDDGDVDDGCDDVTAADDDEEEGSTDAVGLGLERGRGANMPIRLGASISAADEVDSSDAGGGVEGLARGRGANAPIRLVAPMCRGEDPADNSVVDDASGLELPPSIVVSTSHRRP